MTKEEKIEQVEKLLKSQIVNLNKRLEITKEASKEAKKIKEEIMTLKE